MLGAVVRRLAQEDQWMWLDDWGVGERFFAEESNL